ncbi:C40 family peptidase [Geodermatophilus sp. SYSU D01186]
MTTARTSSARRTIRGIAVAAIAGAGIALTPATASAAPDTTAVSAAAVASPAAQSAVNTALAQVGDPYRWGASGPNAFDCSGLTSFAYRAAGVGLPRTARAQSGAGVAVSRDNLQPGDLLFFYRPVSHVAMYIGNGKMVHALRPGQPVRVDNVSYMPSYAGARRIA